MLTLLKRELIVYLFLTALDQTINLEYVGDDGRVWLKYAPPGATLNANGYLDLAANTDGSSLVTITLPTPVFARALRFIVAAYQTKVMLRVEVS